MELLLLHVGLSLSLFLSLSLSLSISHTIPLFPAADYSGVNIMNFGPFSNTVRCQCVNVPIVLDAVPESDEEFTVTADENVNGVVITTPTTTVTIVDCKYNFYYDKVLNYPQPAFQCYMLKVFL